MSTLRTRAIAFTSAKNFNTTSTTQWAALNHDELLSLQNVGPLAIIRLFLTQINAISESEIKTGSLLCWCLDLIAALDFVLANSFQQNSVETNRICRFLVEETPDLGSYHLAAKNIAYMIIPTLPAKKSSNNAVAEDNDPKISELCLNRMRSTCKNGKSCSKSHLCPFCCLYHNALFCEEEKLKIVDTNPKKRSGSNSNRSNNRGRGQLWSRSKGKLETFLYLFLTNKFFLTFLYLFLTIFDHHTLHRSCRAAFRDWYNRRPGTIAIDAAISANGNPYIHIP